MTEGRKVQLLLNRHQALALSLLGLLVISLLGAGSISRIRSVPLTSADKAGARLDVNAATAAELRLVPGLGQSLSARLVQMRQSRGDFQSIDQLIDVRGIGPVKLEQMRPFVTAGGSK